MKLKELKKNNTKRFLISTRTNIKNIYCIKCKKSRKNKSPNISYFHQLFQLLTVRVKVTMKYNIERRRITLDISYS